MHDVRKWVRAAVAGLVGAVALSAVPVLADVKLPAVLSDHMVLQQGQPVPVWGTADAGEEVTVTFGEQKQTTKAGQDGKWSVKLTPLTASDKPAELTVKGKNTVTLKDVLVGEVWVCSGQSNMEWSVKASKDPDKEIAAAKYPNVRLFDVPNKTAEEPQSDVAAKWTPCSPETVAPFSAVGYYFGRELHKELNVPIGLIHSSWGGTIAEAWADRKALEADADYAQILERGKPVTEEAYKKQLENWQKAAEKAKAEGKQAPRKPAEPKNNPNRPAVLYNAMIAPIVPFAAKGAIWYQGESNAGRAEQYRKLLPTMIKSWRDAWGNPDFKFYIVQLANFQDPPKAPGDDDWAELREAQWLTGQQPNNGVILAIDLADADNPRDIHPRNKQDVGKRLALAALANVYGKQVAWSGPVFESHAADGNKVKLKFKHAEGLEARGSGKVQGFQIAGEDKKWHWAEGKVEGDTVTVWSDAVSKPAAVRYNWAHNPQGNLYNKAGLPTAPFRTDDWPGVTAGKK